MKDRTRVDVILDALHLKPVRLKGDRAWLECPVHAHDGKRSVTMFVRRYGPNVGRFYCFSCRQKGGLAKLASLVRSCPMDEAKDFVRKAGKGFEPPRLKVRVVATQPMLSRRRFEMPREVVSKPFSEWLGMARDYWIDRGLGEEEVGIFQVGYATHGHYAGRIVVPFLDERGRPGTVSGRTFLDEEPKYKTPHESDAPDLDVFFGMHLWPEVEHRKKHIAYVSEGALDAMSAARAWMRGGERKGPMVQGPLTVAALGGSDVRGAHILALATFGGVVIATDADPAGERAAKRLAYGLAGHARVVRLALPSDANEMLRRRPRDLARRISSAIAEAAP